MPHDDGYLSGIEAMARTCWIDGGPPLTGRDWLRVLGWAALVLLLVGTALGVLALAGT